jgi:hypothetical protein
MPRLLEASILHLSVEVLSLVSSKRTLSCAACPGLELVQLDSDQSESPVMRGHGPHCHVWLRDNMLPADAVLSPDWSMQRCFDNRKSPKLSSVPACECSDLVG